MTTPALTAEPTQPIDPAPRSDNPRSDNPGSDNPGSQIDDAYFRQTIRTLLDAGTKLVQDLVADPATPCAAKIEPYDRLARAIRRTIALGRHIAENPTPRAASATHRRAQSRRQLIRDVENAIETYAEHPEHAESLLGELDERLDDPEFDHDLATRPLWEIIRNLKRDLGLEHDRYPRRTPADIRALNARAAAPPNSRLHREPGAYDVDNEPDQARTTAPLIRLREAADG